MFPYLGPELIESLHSAGEKEALVQNSFLARFSSTNSLDVQK